jgi:hypothetical protein
MKKQFGVLPLSFGFLQICLCIHVALQAKHFEATRLCL